jgi:hypothetical protein
LEPIKPVSIEKSYTPQNYSGLLQEWVNFIKQYPRSVQGHRVQGGRLN